MEGWCSCQLTPPELPLPPVPRDEQLGDEQLGELRARPLSERPQTAPSPLAPGGRCCKTRSGTETSEAFPSCLVKASPPESPARLGAHHVGSRQRVGRCYYRNRAKHLTPGELQAALAILK